MARSNLRGLLHSWNCVLKKLIRVSIPTPMEYLVAFEGMPAHLRKSELAEIAKQSSFRISKRLRPQMDDNDVTLKAIQMDPLSLQIRRRFKEQALSDDEDKTDNEGDKVHLQNMHMFKLTECSSVLLPETATAPSGTHSACPLAHRALFDGAAFQDTRFVGDAQTALVVAGSGAQDTMVHEMSGPSSRPTQRA